jgi:hypothetical protein
VNTSPLATAAPIPSGAVSLNTASSNWSSTTIKLADYLLDGKVGISRGDCHESLFVAADTLPFGDDLACLICEHGLDRTDPTRGQLSRLGGTGTTAFDNPCKICVKPLPCRHLRSVPTSSFAAQKATPTTE